MSDQYTKPFRGILYDRNRIGDIASCVCPPYDIIPSDAAYLERNPFNAVRLELPRSLPGVDQYTNARQTFDQWCSSGVLSVDDRETIYVYEQQFTVEGSSYLRWGFIGLTRLDKDRILTHEQTRSKAKEDREKLIVSLKAFTSFVFGLYEDKAHEIDTLLEGSRKEQVYDFVDEDSIRNRFYRMTDPEEINRLVALVNARKIYVADGHHRLDVSYRLNLRYIPLYLTNMYSTGIVILPYHRLVKLQGERSLPELLSMLEGHARVETVAFTGPEVLTQVLHTISASSEPAFALYSKDDPAALYILTVGKPQAGDGPLENLKVNILHSGILKSTLCVKEEEISFTQDPHELVRAVRNGDVDLGLLLPPTTVQEVKAVADNSLDMPPKSTFFYPKILTGLVYHRYA